MTSKYRVVSATLVAVSCSGLLSGCASKADVSALEVKSAAFEKALSEAHADFASMKEELVATRTRLDNALRANADASSDTMSEKARLQALGGQVEELTHTVDELKKDLASSRRELDTRLDDMKHAQDVSTTPKAPPVTIPADKPSHFAAISAAYGKGDYTSARTLGREYVAKYPDDDKTDDALYLLADASLKENRPSSALGEYNRILKQFPKSNTLAQTLYGMGEAYLLLHDCSNAKLAFSACESRFSKEKIGQDAKAQIAKIAKPQPGMCAPQ